MLADGIHVEGYGKLTASASYESNVPFVLRFMVRTVRNHLSFAEMRL